MRKACGLVRQNNAPLKVGGETAALGLVNYDVVMKGSRRAEGRVFEMNWQAGG
jgi:hypothetical protein